MRITKEDKEESIDELLLSIDSSWAADESVQFQAIFCGDNRLQFVEFCQEKGIDLDKFNNFAS